MDLTHQLEPVDSRHPDVREDQVEALARDDGDRLGGVLGLGDAVPDARENALERAPVELLVVYDQNVRFGQRESSAERRGVARV